MLGSTPASAPGVSVTDIMDTQVRIALGFNMSGTVYRRAQQAADVCPRAFLPAAAHCGTHNRHIAAARTCCGHETGDKDE